jgi:peptidoglycan hydrolase-like protein with peptidoglycan-binding domain
VGEKTTQALGGEWKTAGTTWSVSRILRKTSPLMKGADVKALQSALIAKGYSCGGTGADGEFGKNTESAVKSFQKAAGLAVDGKAGKNTVTKLGGKWEG